MEVQLPELLGTTKRYRLRWCFEFANKAPRRGMWNMSSENPAEMAAYVDKTGATYAIIEGEHVVTSEIKRIVECPIADFVTFDFLRGLPVPLATKKSSFTAVGFVMGITLVSTTHSYTVHLDGSVHVEPRSEQDKQRTIVGV